MNTGVFTTPHSHNSDHSDQYNSLFLSYLENITLCFNKLKILNNPVVLHERVGLQSKDETLWQRTKGCNQPGQHQHCSEIFSLVKGLNNQSFFSHRLQHLHCLIRINVSSSPPMATLPWNSFQILPPSVPVAYEAWTRAGFDFFHSGKRGKRGKRYLL